VPLPDRRAFLAACSGAGLGATLLPGVLWAKLAAGAELTPETVKAAEELAGVAFDDAERAGVIAALKGQRAQLDALHALPLDNAVPPAVHFDVRVPGAPRAVPRPGAPATRATSTRMTRSMPSVAAVPRDADLAFQPVTVLAELVRTRQVSAAQLAELYLARLTRHDTTLRCVVTLTAERARAQARQLDAELAAGRYRGPLHGIPWGAKDLLAVRGHPTTWGAGPFRDQVIDADAEVVRRLDAGRRGARGQAVVGRAGAGRRVVRARAHRRGGRGGRDPRRRAHAQPVEAEQGSSGLERGAGERGGGGARRVRDRQRDVRQHLVAEHAVRRHRAAADVRAGAAHRRDGAVVEHGQARADVPLRGGLRARARRDPRARRAGRGVRGRAVPVGPRRRWRGCAWGTCGRRSSCRRPDPADPARPATPPSRSTTRRSPVLRGAARPRRARRDAPRGAVRRDAHHPHRGGGRRVRRAHRSDRDAELVQQGPNDWATTFRAARFIPAVDYVNANRTARWPCSAGRPCSTARTRWT
jgi:hypothetical protein